MARGMAGTLPTPGAVGRGLRLVIGVVVLLSIRGLIGPWRSLLDGRLPSTDWGFWSILFLAAYLTSITVDEAFGRAWGQRPLLAVAGGAAATAGVGLIMGGGSAASWLGGYLYVWLWAFVLFFGVALVLAALVGTPGCEMRVYRHLVVLVSGGDADTVSCRGWIDRFDDVRLGRARSGP